LEISWLQEYIEPPGTTLAVLFELFLKINSKQFILVSITIDTTRNECPVLKPWMDRFGKAEQLIMLL
jgi:hypothetical protein